MLDAAAGAPPGAAARDAAYVVTNTCARIASEGAAEAAEAAEAALAALVVPAAAPPAAPAEVPAASNICFDPA